MIIFVLLNLSVFFCVGVIINAFFKDYGILNKVLIGFCLGIAQIIFTEQILGVFSLLTLSNLIVINLLICIFLLVFSRIRKFKKTIGRYVAIPEFNIFENRIILFAFAILSGFILVKLFLNLINPPLGWDSLNYHFTFPVEWLKNGNLINTITVSCNPAPPYYPINGSLFYFWLMAPFKSVFLADLGQFPFFLISFIAIYSIAVSIGIRKELSVFAALLTVVTPNFLKQIEIAYVDIMVAALFWVALMFLINLYKKYSFKHVVIFALASGLLIGVKTLAITYSIVLIIPFLFIVFKNTASTGVKRSLLYLLVFSLFVIVFGGYGYIRNIFLTGNPLYPLKMTMLGKVIFDGVLGKNVFQVSFTPYDYSLSKVLFHEGFGLQSILLFFPAVLSWLIIFKYKVKNIIIYLLFLPAMLLAVYYFLIPFPCTRFLYPFLGVAAIAAFYVLNKISLNLKIVSSIFIICFLSSIFELSGHMELIVSLLLGILLFVISVRFRDRIVLIRINKKGILIAALVVIVSLKFIEGDYKKHEYERYVKKYPSWHYDGVIGWKWLNDNTEGDNIAYVGKPEPFPLYGRGFKNNVYYVSVNDVEPKLHNYKNSFYTWGADFLTLHRSLEEDGNYRGNADYSIWLNNLLREKTDLLFVYSLSQVEDIEFPMEDKWAQEHAESFELVYGNSSVHIYKILK
ncbi:MAG: hypothetical protein P9M06_00730 [Candidatus Saelkia tenebricola]|nr:hypothetical protein [Candidatus Saelkia tenebricola]